METNVFPLATSLVARPHAAIALRAGPSVERDDKRARVVAIVRHHARHVGNAIKAKRVAGAYPRHVGLQHAHACVAHLFHDVTLKQGRYGVYRVKVRLCPQAYLHAVLAGIVAKALQVGNVAVERRGLAVAGAIAVVWQHPSQWQVVIFVPVHHGAGGELIVVLLPVQAFLYAAVVFLALLVSFAILKEYALGVGRLFPIVAVVGVEVSLIEGELGQEHGIARKLVVVAQQGRGRTVHHEEHVKVRCVMG